MDMYKMLLETMEDGVLKNSLPQETSQPVDVITKINALAFELDKMITEIRDMAESNGQVEVMIMADDALRTFQLLMEIIEVQSETN